MKKYDKLVRDNIPEIIKNEGLKCKTRILDDREYEVELRKKLIEEATELYEATNIEDKIYELADIYEIIDYILMTNKIDKREIDNARVKKNMKSGGFEDKIFLEYIN